MNILTNFPESEELLNRYKERNIPASIYEVNGHIHSPYSFSAFQQISEAFEMAKAEGIKVLGINDFYTPKGYDEFYEFAVKNKIFPLFNVEFISLSKKHQEQNLLVNDPNNPGRTYFSGKGLNYPFALPAKLNQKLDAVIEESMKQVAAMIEKTNRILDDINAGFSISAKEIQQNFAKELVRERHIAKALRLKIYDTFSEDTRRKNFLRTLFSGKESKSGISDFAAIENEIRGNLLKKGGAAFVEEDEKAFLSLEEVIEIIVAAGGIPCYPVLLDDPKGNFTDFERNWEKMYAELKSKNINCIELIPTRNSLKTLTDFVHFFDSKSFIITFGTEHNTPVLEPVKVRCRGNVELPAKLKEISFRGTCIIAAHQYLKAKGKTGYIDTFGKPYVEKQDKLFELGRAVIERFISDSI